MTRTGPQKIPGALFDLYFGDGRYAGTDMEVNCGVLHTTEGPTLYDYNSGAVAPTVTGVPDMNRHKIVWHQHFDVDESARALVHASGQPATNTANAFQIELVGTCDPDNATTWRLGSQTLRAGVDYIYWPTAPDWVLAELAWLMRWLSDNHGIPLTSGLTWEAYPASSGADNGVRMSIAQWQRFTGWCGHQHVPENEHGDPGSINITRLLALATGTTTPTEEDPMPFSEQDIRRFIREETLGSVTSVQGRDTVAYAVHWWLQKALTGTPVPAVAGQPWGDLLPRLTAALAQLPAPVLAQLQAAVAEAIVHVDVNVTGPTPTHS
jgi:hypothetical protein